MAYCILGCIIRRVSTDEPAVGTPRSYATDSDKSSDWPTAFWHYGSSPSFSVALARHWTPSHLCSCPDILASTLSPQRSVLSAQRSTAAEARKEWHTRGFYKKIDRNMLLSARKMVVCQVPGRIVQVLPGVRDGTRQGLGMVPTFFFGLVRISETKCSNQNRNHSEWTAVDGQTWILNTEHTKVGFSRLTHMSVALNSW